MESLFGGELGLLGGGEGLRDDSCGVGVVWSAPPLQDDMYPASHFALAAAYHDIKTRLASLERENSSIKRKLKNYEVKVGAESHCQNPSLTHGPDTILVQLTYRLIQRFQFVDQY